MEFLFIFLFCFLATFFLFSYGYIFNKFFFNFKITSYIEIIIIGAIVLTFLALLINFFFSLSPLLNTFIFILSFAILFFHKEINVISLLKIIFIISSIGFITFILDHSNRPDAGLYHLPYISILNNEKIIFGSVNLHFRFGHISSLQYLSSLFNNLIFNDNGILIPLTIIYSSSLLFFYDQLKKNFENLSVKLFSFFSIVFILTSMNRYSEFGNDDPAAIFFLITIFYFFSSFVVKNSDQSNFFNKIILFSAATFLMKQFYALLIFFPIFLFFTNYKKIKLINTSNIFSSLLVFFWLIKNIIVSSCFVYPVSFTCLNSLSWSSSTTNFSPKIVAISSEAWAKSFPDRIDKSKNEIQHLSDHEWIFGWLDNHLQIVLNNLLPLIAIAVVIILISFKSIKKKSIIPKIFYIIFALNFIFSLFWFIKFPTYRYGAGYLGSLIIIGIIIIYEKIIFKSYLNKILISILLILSVIVLSKNLKRIIENYDKIYVDYPWPKKNSFTNENFKNTNKPIYQDHEIIYYKPYPYALCMYSTAPCTNFKNKILKRNIFSKYKLFLPDE